MHSFVPPFGLNGIGTQHIEVLQAGIIALSKLMAYMATAQAQPAKTACASNGKPSSKHQRTQSVSRNHLWK